MSLLLAAAAAAGIHTAPITENERLFSPSDVPVRDLNSGIYHVGSAVIVGPNGRAQACIIYVSSGNRKLDAHTCRLIRARARFSPASDPSGSPKYGLKRLMIGYAIAESPLPNLPMVGDLQLQVASLPPEIGPPAEAKIMFAVNAQGVPSSCTAHPKNKHPSLAAVACEHVGEIPAIVVQDEHGNAVPSVQDAAVVFVVEKQP